MLYEKKPVTVDAFLWTGRNFSAFLDFIHKPMKEKALDGFDVTDANEIRLKGNNSVMKVNPNNWIVYTEDRIEIYTQTMFDETYTAVKNTVKKETSKGKK